MRPSRQATSFIFLLFCAAAAARAITLKPETVAAWEHYLASVNSSVKAASRVDASFLDLDQQPDLQRQEIRRGGKVIVSEKKRAGASSVPFGLIHDWQGVIFIPNATLSDVFAVTRSYDRYPQWYGPTIVAGHALPHRDDTGEERFTIRYIRHVLFVTAVLDAEYQSRYVQISATRWYSITRSTHMQEVDQSSSPPQQTLLPPDDQGGGYLWRVYDVTKYEQKDNGVYLEEESIGLSRPIPPSLGWMLEPVVRRLVRGLLERSLVRTRDAVLSVRKQKS